MNPIDLGATPFAPLSAHLLDLLHALEGQELDLILVGGFGLFLRRRHVEQAGVKTLYAVIPEPRATEDFDVMLKLQLMADFNRMKELRAALDALGYQVVEQARAFQFVKPGTARGSQRDVKIDLLARKPGAADPPLHYDERRVKPAAKNSPLHGRLTPEAIAVEEGLLHITLSGQRTSGEPYIGSVCLPTPYAFFLMKLFAFRDEAAGKKGKRREPYARKHALDLYTISALLTAEEYDALAQYRERYASDQETADVTREAGAIVAEFFADQAAPGALRLKEHPDFPAANQLDDFLSLLAEIFPV